MKLHIGCGKKYLPGYKHMDIMKYDHIDYIGTAEDLSIFADNSIEEIYACHIIEHIKRGDIAQMLREWHRVLEPQGTLRVAAPDFEAIVEEYLHSHNLEAVIGLLYGGQNYEYNFHYQTYDFIRLEKLLLDAGFVNVQRYLWNDFLPEGFDDFSRAYLPHMDFENGRLMSLNVVATKAAESNENNTLL